MAVQLGSPEPIAQLAPEPVGLTTMLVIVPVAPLSTVIVYVISIWAPTASGPAHESSGRSYTAPLVASLLYVATLSALDRSSVNAAGSAFVKGAIPVLVTVMVYLIDCPDLAVEAEALLATV